MRFILIGLLVGLMTPGCGKDKEEAKKTPKVSTKKKGPSRAPVRQAVVKTKQGVPTSMPASRPASRPMGKLPPGHPPMGGGAASQPAAAGSGGNINGTITLDKAQADKIKAGSTLFIIVRRDEGEGKKGMMLAAKKIAVTGAAMFPLKYTVTPKDVMMAGTSLVGNVRVSARVDQDGDAISKQPGDVIGAAKAPVTVGGKKNADFSLDSKI